MTEPQLGLVDTQYWDNPMRNVEAIDERLHEGEDFRGICIGGPARVSLENHSTIPVLVYQNDSFHRRWHYRLEDRAVVVAVDHRANLTYARQALEREPEYVPSRSPEPPDDPGMTASSALLVELRERLRLPWARAGYFVSAIVRDQVSNRIHIQVGPSPSRYQDDEVERYLEELRRRSGPRAVRPPVTELPVPHYGKMDSSPAIPQTPGISMVMPRVHLVRSRTRSPWLLEGSFRVPALPRDILPAGMGQIRNYPRPATAVVGIALVLVGADEPGPWVLQLGVPSFDPIDPNEERPFVTGHFLVDLFDVPECPSVPQTYFAYAFACEVMAGPVPSALIDEAMLPPEARGVR